MEIQLFVSMYIYFWISITCEHQISRGSQRISSEPSDHDQTHGNFSLRRGNLSAILFYKMANFTSEHGESITNMSILYVFRMAIWTAFIFPYFIMTPYEYYLNLTIYLFHHVLPIFSVF